VLRDGGAVVKALVQEMRITVEQLEKAAATSQSDAAGLALIARRLEAGIQAYENASGFVLSHAAENVRAVFLGSVPYLMLAGVVHAGWQMARAALACAEHVNSGTTT